MPQLITIDPEPPQAGGTIKVCYDFSDVPHKDVTLTLQWHPDSVPAGSVELTKDAPCAEITIPAAATALAIVDPTAYSDTLGAVIAP